MTLPIFDSAGDNIIEPDGSLVSGGFQKNQEGNNGWLNYLLNLISIHCQVPISEVIFYPAATMSTQYDGWLLGDGSTLGSSSSAATHNNDQYEVLFGMLWASDLSGNLVISGGKGASPSADWSANKTITLPDIRGRTIANVDTSSKFFTEMFGKYGEETHALILSEMPEHAHLYYEIGDPSGQTPGGGSNTFFKTGSPIATGSSGSGTPHANVQPSYVGNWYIKAT